MPNEIINNTILKTCYRNFAGPKREQKILIHVYCINGNRSGIWSSIRLSVRLCNQVLDSVDSAVIIRTVKIREIAKVSKGAKIRNRYNQVPHLT